MKHKKNALNKTQNQFENLINENIESFSDVITKTGTSSTRTTFKLGKDVSEKLNFLKEKYEKEYKEIIDDMLETIIENKLLEHIFDGARNINQNNPQTKTYVLSKKSFDTLNKLSNENDLKRDHLLESIIIFNHSLEKVFEKRRTDKYKKALELLYQCDEYLNNIDSELSKIINIKDDPVVFRFGYAVLHNQNLITAVEDNIEKGTEIEI